MTALPPLRLTGATVLTERPEGPALVARDLALRAGRIVGSDLPPVDMSGLVLLPGIVDLASEALEPRLTGALPGEDAPAALLQLDAKAARAGITTLYAVQHWGWGTGARSPATARAVMRALPQVQARAATDLHLHLRAEIRLTDSAAELIALAEEERFSLLTLHDSYQQQMDLARASGTPADQGLVPQLRAAAEAGVSVPRHVCSLAVGLDEAGLRYGSYADPDAETREGYAMIGARLALAPPRREVAACAKAYGDPVLWDAGLIDTPLDAARLTQGIAQGLVQGLVSGAKPGYAVHAAATLVRLGAGDLARCWGLVSSGPARVARLHDRGTLEPGYRADIAVWNPASGRVEATICGGRLTFASGEALSRLLGLLPGQMAAE